MNQPSGSVKRVSSQTEPPMDEPDAKRPLGTTLEFAPNDLDDATHTRLDEAVLKTMGDEPFSLFSAMSLLATIVSSSEGRLDPKYEENPNAKALLQEHPELMDKLKVAWMAKKFKEIRNLEILRAKISPQTLPRSEGMGVPVEYKNAVIKAWRSNYIGQAHKALLKAIDNVHTLEEKANYAKILTIIQSSGTGKSKTVDAMAMERILFPLCLRENLGAESFAYPPPDAGVRDSFLRAPNADEEEECKSYLRSFLCALFDSVRDEAKTLLKKKSGRRMSYSSMVKGFYKFFADGTKRNSFYDMVAAKWATTSKADPKDTWISFQLAKDTLMKCCSDWPAKEFCPIIISVDEVHVLFTPRVQDVWSRYTLYSRFKSVVSELVQRDFCVLFLSTVSSVSRLAPSKAVADSLRERSDDLVLPPPFTELSFDVHLIAKPLAPGKETLASVGSFEFTSKFGRPMFYSTYISRVSERKAPPQKIALDIMRIARMKLSGRSALQAAATLDPSSIAILSTRLLLDLSPTASMARQYEEDQIRSHLRMLYSVLDDRYTLVSGSSPEPLVAEASAQLMHSNVIINEKQVPYMDVWELLVQFVERGFQPQGTIGELLGRVFSIFAMDRAIEATLTKRELKYQTPVTVAEYYKALLTDDAWKVLKDSTPANRSNLTKESGQKRFEDAFADAYLHFSHYGKANDETPIQDRYGWALWLRGTAILCQLNQTRSDRALPIFFSKPTYTLSAHSTSMVLDQDKTGQKEDPGTVAIQDAEILGLFTQGEKLPYIAAVHCYALTEGEGISMSRPNTYELRSPPNDKVAPRYQIDFRGLAAYRNITDRMKSDIRRMIDGTKNTIFRQHPRQDNLDLLRQMLPLLNGDSSTTAWFGGLDQPSPEKLHIPSQGGGGGEPSRGGGRGTWSQRGGGSSRKKRK